MKIRALALVILGVALSVAPRLRGECNPVPGGSADVNCTGNLGIGANPSPYPLFIQRPGAPIVGSVYSSVWAIEPIVNGAGVWLGYDGSNGVVGSTKANSALSFFTNSNSQYLERMRLTADGNLGIGTSAPSGPFHVSAPSLNAYFSSREGVSTGYSRVFVNNDAGRGPTLISYGSAFAGTSSYGSLPWADLNMLLGYSTSGLVIATNSAAPLVFGTSEAERLRITPTGEIGVGISAPDRKFHVNGGVKASGPIGGFIFNDRNQTIASSMWVWYAHDGLARLFRNGSGGQGDVLTVDQVGNVTIMGNINAKYQDIAEWVPAADELSPGTVVVLDPTADNHVVASSSPYDTSVAGVISARPGVVLGESGEGKVLVATTGRVNVRTDASFGAVKVGDLLVTSPRRGYAMRSEAVEISGRRMHQPGTIIGKALQALRQGDGEILVLLSLQ